MDEVVNDLKKVIIFRNASSKILEKIAQIVSGPQHYKSGETIYDAYTNDSLIILSAGQAKVFTIAENGNEKILYTVQNNMIDGAANLFLPNQLSKYMQATIDSTIYRIRQADFQSLINANPDIAIQLLNTTAFYLLKMETNLARRDLTTSKMRIMSYLKDWQKEQGDTGSLLLPMKKKDFANLLGTTPETLSRQLKQLEIDKKIMMNGSHIKII